MCKRLTACFEPYVNRNETAFDGLQGIFVEALIFCDQDRGGIVP